MKPQSMQRCAPILLRHCFSGLGAAVIAGVILSCGRGPSNTSGQPEIPVSSRETWVINGVEFQIDQTAVVAYPNGKFLFVVKVPFDGPLGESQRPVAKSIARYWVPGEPKPLDCLAPLRGAPRGATRLRVNGKPPLLEGDVGVALMSKKDILLGNVAIGYRFRFLPQELEE